MQLILWAQHCLAQCLVLLHCKEKALVSIIKQCLKIRRYSTYWDSLSNKGKACLPVLTWILISKLLPKSLFFVEDELGRLSPAATTACTTRATSPFPDQQQLLKKLLKYAEQSLEPAWHLETTSGKYIGLPSYARAFESFHTDPDWYNPVKELSGNK